MCCIVLVYLQFSNFMSSFLRTLVPPYYWYHKVSHEIRSNLALKILRRLEI